MSSFVNTCCIKNCTPKSREKTNGHLSVKFYRFPSSTVGSAWKIDKRLKWINAVKNYVKYSSDWEPQNHSRICSFHFINNEKSENPTHPSYIPSIFPEDENIESVQRLQRLECEIQSHQIISVEKRQYGKWEEENMQQAIDAYRNKNCGFNECCRRFGIPKPTFRRHINGTIKRPLSFVKKNGNLPTLSENIEKELINRILNHESNFLGPSITDVRRLAFEIAEENKLPHKFNRKIKMAGRKWFYDFLKRHPNLPIRLSENTSKVQVTGSNKEAKSHFFEKLEKYIQLNGIDVNRIYNMDESTFSTVQKKCGKIVSQRRKKRIERVVSGKRRLNTTIVYCANATGSFVPPMFIFRECLPPQLRIEFPPGSLIEVAEHGFMTSELFVKWLQHFIDCAKATLDRKIILLLDGYFTHTKSLKALELAQRNGVILLQFPGHTAHRLQPLDVGIFGPMQTYYNQALDQWATCNAGKCITQNDAAPLITSAYFKAATISDAVGAFKVSGCWPPNRFIFNNGDFTVSDFFNELGALNEPKILIKPETLYEHTILNPVKSNSGKELSSATTAIKILTTSITSNSDDEISCLKVPITPIFPITKRSRGETIEEIVTVDYNKKIKDELIEENDLMQKKRIKDEIIEETFESIKEEYEPNNLTNSCSGVNLKNQHLTNIENIKLQRQLNTEFIIKDEISGESISESEQIDIDQSSTPYKRTHTVSKLCDIFN